MSGTGSVPAVPGFRRASKPGETRSNLDLQIETKTKRERDEKASKKELNKLANGMSEVLESKHLMEIRMDLNEFEWIRMSLNGIDWESTGFRSKQTASLALEN